MSASSVHLRFLHQCHCRRVIWRVVEFAGIGAAIGSAVGFFILPVLFFRAQSTIAPACISLGVAALVGAIFGCMRRPTLVQTALEADGQLKLNDLLSTVVITNQNSSDGFALSIRAQAEEICRNLSPSELIVRRLGGPAWGGIGIASSLLLTLAMMTTQPSQGLARVDAADADQIASNTTRRTDIPSTETNRPAALSRQLAEQPEQSPRDRSLDERDGDASAQAVSRTSRQGSNSAGDGTGLTSGKTNESVGARIIPSQEKSASDVNGELSQGDGRASAGGVGTSPGSAAGVVVSREPASAPPWKSATWNADRAEATKNVQSGKTPDAYREMVREYFNSPQ